MKRFTSLAILSTLMMIGTAPASAQQLWGETEYGVSRAIVSVLYPRAVVPEQPDNFGRAREELRLDRLVVDDITFRVQFMFYEDSLEVVILRFTGTGSFDEVQKQFTHISNMLTSKYLAPVCEETKKEPWRQEINHWVQSDLSIIGSLTEPSDDSGSFRLIYGKRFKGWLPWRKFDEAHKL